MTRSTGLTGRSGTQLKKKQYYLKSWQKLFWWCHYKLNTGDNTLNMFSLKQRLKLASSAERNTLQNSPFVLKNCSWVGIKWRMTIYKHATPLEGNICLCLPVPEFKPLHIFTADVYYLWYWTLACHLSCYKGWPHSWLTLASSQSWAGTQWLQPHDWPGVYHSWCLGLPEYGAHTEESQWASGGRFLGLAWQKTWQKGTYSTCMITETVKHAISKAYMLRVDYDIGPLSPIPKLVQGVCSTKGVIDKCVAIR